MCLILIALHQHPEYPLIVAANRDEYFNRPTSPAGFWQQTPQLLAGLDREAGGTWLGVTRSGRFAALTNVREPDRPSVNNMSANNPISRGKLVSDFLLTDLSPFDYLQQLDGSLSHYNGFNLLCGDLRSLLKQHDSSMVYRSNRGSKEIALEPGVHGISNSQLNTPWPKLVSGCDELKQCLTQHHPNTESLFDILNQRQRAPDDQLPDTGVSLEMERMLSSRFIEGQEIGYGTRASTVLLLQRDGQIQFTEQSWNRNGERAGRVEFEFRL